MPGRAFLKKSLALWQRRVAYRRQRVLAYKRRAATERKHGGVTSATKWKLALWERRYAYAGRVVAKRQRQLHAKPATGSGPIVTGQRGKAISRWNHRLGLTEQPAGSNRGPGITDMQRALGAWLIGLAWCGVYVADGLLAAGVPVTARMASVALIEDDAKAGRYGLRRWIAVGFRQAHGITPGDVAVLFGRGVHTEGIIEVHDWGLVTDGGNTSPENGGGSQSNGGGSYRRNRPWRNIYGVAVPAYQA